jgi:RNA polymerase sigma-70 factor (ECF subfamily)
MPPGMNNQPYSDEQLAFKAQRGCASSFEELVRRYQTRLINFLRRRTANAADAEDLTQDTFVRAYENLHRFNDSGRFSTWLFTIARRLCINHGQKKRPIANSEALHSLESLTSSPEQTVSDRENRRQLWDLVAEILNERQMTAIWLYYVEGMPVAQIAPVVERSRVAVKMMLFRARKKLLPVLEELELHEPAGAKSAKRDDLPSPAPAKSAAEKPIAESTNG